MGQYVLCHHHSFDCEMEVYIFDDYDPSVVRLYLGLLFGKIQGIQEK